MTHIFDTASYEATTPCRCPNCDWTGPLSDVRPDIQDLFERVIVGGEIPAGECPDCGALVYVCKPDDERRNWPLFVITLACGGTYVIRQKDMQKAVEEFQTNCFTLPLGYTIRPAAGSHL